MTGPDLTASYVEFWRERHLCTLSTLRADGTPHLVPVGAVLDAEAGCAWVITSRTSQKARNIVRAGPGGAPVAVCQVDGRRWATLEGIAEVLDAADSVREAERLYAQRYRTPRPNPDRVAVRIALRRALGNA